MTKHSDSPRPYVRRTKRSRYGIIWSFLIAVFFLAAGEPEAASLPRPFESLVNLAYVWSDTATYQYGRSNALHVRLAMPEEHIPFNLGATGDTAGLLLGWRPWNSTDTPSVLQPLSDTLIAPRSPGFYYLASLQRNAISPVSRTAIAVLVPFAKKRGAFLEGYRIGFYRRPGRPRGFLRVGNANEANIRISDHLTVGDFITRDAQEQWPRYIALNQLLVDKVELVIQRIAERTGRTGKMQDAIHIHSGFRTPAHNARVHGSAHDSRHMYGAALDIAIDVNGDGRFTASDARAVAKVVNEIEHQYPILVGGLGTYLRSRSESFSHIDVRTKRSRWRG